VSDDDLLRWLLATAPRSDCDKIRFGAAALDELGEVMTNGFAVGWNHNSSRAEGWSCAEHCVGGIRRGVKSGTCVERCYAIHAEQHALLRAGGRAYEIAVAGLLPDGSLFDNGGGFYCTVCARIMAAAGVQTVSIWSSGQRVRLTMADAWNQSYSIATA
jgi:deoxycytidylate deaminase